MELDLDSRPRLEVKTGLSRLQPDPLEANCAAVKTLVFRVNVVALCCFEQPAFLQQRITFFLTAADPSSSTLTSPGGKAKTWRHHDQK
jgi:hypothetical protein